MPQPRSLHHRARVAGVACLLALFVLPRAAAAQSMRDLLSFLLTNRSISTDDFARDEQAAAESRDTITAVLLAELGTLPVDSSGSGFTYRLDETFGGSERSSESFGPFFVERSLTVGRRQASFGFAYRTARFNDIDGRKLRDGTLVATAARLTTDEEPFDVETLSLVLDTATMTVAGTFGLTDRLEVGGSVPFVRLRLRGERVDTYRGTASLQARGSGTTSGIGDLAVRAKYNVIRDGGSGLSIGADWRLPTGSEENLLGSGRSTLRPRAVGSVEYGSLGLHGDLGYVVGGRVRELNYGGAVTFVTAPRLTIVGEAIGRRLSSFGRLTDSIESHPTLTGVETIRLTSEESAAHRILVVLGFKWNVASTWLLSANVIRPVTTVGLNAGWIPTITFDYAIGR